MMSVFGLWLILLVVDINSLRQKPIYGNLEDACALGNKEILTYNEALGCYRQFPMNETIRRGTLDTVEKILEFYAFKDIAMDSPDYKIPLKLNLKGEIKQMRYNRYANEFEFHYNLMHLINKLNDGHTAYSSRCISSFIFRQPFPIVTVADELNLQKFIILEQISLPEGFQEAWLKSGIDINKYKGAEIVLMDSIPVKDYFIHYANHFIGSSKDINSRINLALARVMQRNGRWGIANGGFAATVSVPNKPAITYTLKLKHGGIETISVPYLVNSPMGFRNAKEFYRRYCSYKDFRVKSVSSSYEPSLPGLRVMQIPHVVHEKIDYPLDDVTINEDDPLNNPLTKGAIIQTWIINNNTGVMTITSFVASSEQLFMREAINGFLALRNKGVDRLILDLSNNGGGVICWGYYILDYLFPNSEKKYFDTDMHASDLLIQMAKKDKRNEGFFNYDYWVKPDGHPFYNTDEFIGDHEYIRGNNKSKYTSKFDDQCGPNPLKVIMRDKQPYSNHNLVVVTNSVCYSTCSLLVNGLQEMHGVTTYAMGGIRGQLATAASIQGGTVYNFDYLLDDVSELKLRNHPDAPQPFPIDASMSFTIREAYSTRKFSKDRDLFGNRPLEFTWNSATYHRPYPGPATLLSPYEQWRQIADDFFHHQ